MDNHGRLTVIIAVAITIAQVTSVFVVPNYGSRTIQQYARAVTSGRIDDDDDGDATTTSTTTLTSVLQLQQEFGLTPAQAGTVLRQCRSFSPKQEKIRIEHVRHGALSSWLTTSQGFTPHEVATLVVRHPPILAYDIATNLAPTIEFYREALLLLGCVNNNHTAIPLASFLCASPGLLEYNVQKRLRPRLVRAKAALDGSHHSTNGGVADDDFLRAVATKTDSRFEEWLSLLQGVVVAQEPQPQQPSYPYPSYMILSNLQSGGNIGNILRSASIFGCAECVVVGQRRHRLTGDHGARHDLPRRHVWTHDEARDYLRDVRIYGVEITADASPLMRYDPASGVVTFPFDRNHTGGAAFVLGNEGTGLSDRQREICDEFLYVPQTDRVGGGSRGSASLNVACAATVVLQAYATWAGYPDARREGEKFVSASTSAATT